MKIILSRKGFDSKYGGYPSPILPDGRLISLPIPEKEDTVKYSDIKYDSNKTYFELMNSLRQNLKTHNKRNNKDCDFKWDDLTENTTCHLDPDINKNIIDRKNGWRGCFGQIHKARAHLRNQNVKDNDLFLFFGWFRETIDNRGKIEFKKHAPDRHIIFGYLQVGEIHNNDKPKEYQWMKGHPHIKNETRQKEKTNTIYIARENLEWEKKTPGYGIFKYNEELVLTKEGFTRSKWQLPEYFKKVKISRHSDKSWNPEGYFKSVDIGQEIVIEDNTKVEEWAKTLIKNNRIKE